MGLIATAGTVLIIAWFFFLDQKEKPRSTGALWIPLTWAMIVASRPVSMWLNSTPERTVDQVLDGSPVDRNVFLFLLFLAFIVLLRRGPQVRRILAANVPLVLLLVYCGISILWSDFPAVAFKRWMKFVGDLVMVLIVLTESDPAAALKRFLTRPGFLLIPLSILSIKYYPEIGRGYDRWTYQPILIGITYNKNILGMICLLWGLAALWMFLAAWRQRPRNISKVLAPALILLMTAWLLQKAHSATSLSCFLMGSTLLVWTTFRGVAKRPILVHLAAGAMVLAALSALFLNMGSEALDILGKDSTLTGRTELWEEVLKMIENPVLGTGFESFWLGSRLEHLWDLYWWQPNQAHNGYIETLLNLGGVGVTLLVIVLLTSYHRAIERLRQGNPAAGLALAYIVIAVIYNFTEAAFKMLNPVWLVLLSATVAVPQKTVPAPSPTAERTPNRVTYRRGWESWDTRLGS